MELKQHSPGIWTIANFLSEKECNEFIELSEKLGYEAATVNTDKGAVRIDKVRNNYRVLYTSNELAQRLWQNVKLFAPERIGNSFAVGLNELFRFYKYGAGEQFKKHRDESFIRNDEEASFYTFMIYLDDNYTGGDTTFDNVTIHGETGKALIFRHSLEHEGREVTAGTKYILRTDIMYKLQQE